MAPAINTSAANPSTWRLFHQGTGLVAVMLGEVVDAMPLVFVLCGGRSGRHKCETVLVFRRGPLAIPHPGLTQPAVPPSRQDYRTVKSGGVAIMRSA